MDIRPYTFEPVSEIDASIGGVAPLTPSAGFSSSFQDVTIDGDISIDEVTSEDIKYIEEKAYQKGLAAGKAEADREKLEVEQKLTTVLTDVSVKIGDFFDGCKEKFQKVSDDTVRMAIQIAKKVAGEAIKADPTAAIQGIVRDSMEYIYNEPQVVIVVNSSLEAPMKEKIMRIAREKGFDGKVELVGSESVADGDCTIEWKDGGAKLDIKETWQKIESIIETAGTDISPENVQPASSEDNVEMSGQVAEENKVAEEAKSEDAEEDKNS